MQPPNKPPPLAQVELGYERVERGPTTNFVGNHMTQGAIDLVQAELARPAADRQLLLEGGSGDSGSSSTPRLLAVHPPAAGPPLARSLQEYTWWDSGRTVCVQLDVQLSQQQLACLAPCGTAKELHLRWRISPRSLHLQLASVSPSLPATVEGGEAPPAEALLELVLDPLCHPIQPALCTVLADRPAGLPAVAAAAPAGSSASGPPGPAASEGSICEAAATQVLPPGAALVLMRLHKVDPSLSWPSLKDAGTWLVAGPAQQQPQPQPRPADLAALRCR